jgi:hypothetical protein
MDLWNPPARPNPKYQQKVSRWILAIKFFVDVLGESSVRSDADDFQERIAPLEYHFQSINRLLVKDAIFDGVFKQLNEFVLVKDQVHSIVFPVFILAKSEGFPRGAIHLEEVSLDATLVVLVQLATADSPMLDGVHFWHDLNLKSTKI